MHMISTYNTIQYWLNLLLFICSSWDTFTFVGITDTYLNDNFTDMHKLTEENICCFSKCYIDEIKKQQVK